MLIIIFLIIALCIILSLPLYIIINLICWIFNIPFYLSMLKAIALSFILAIIGTAISDKLSKEGK
jgi:hypothetical protein